MKRSLDKATYGKMQAILEGVVSEAVDGGACQLSLAHAVAPVAVDLLLQMHPPATVKDILSKQVDHISAASEAKDATRH